MAIPVAIPRSSRFQDLTGQRFGQLTIVAFCGYEGPHSLWKCRCDCGGEVVTRANSLKTGNTASCGCGKGGRDDLSGRKYGNLLVLEYVKKNARNKTFWLCQCECGKTTVARSDALKDGSRTSCGCKKGPVPVPVKDRFWDKVSKQEGEGCWEWQGPIEPTKGGYGYLGSGNGHVLAHRASYEMAFGEIPNGQCVLHRCDNPKCVRPDHLFLGTRADNAKDRESKGRGRCKVLNAVQVSEIWQRLQVGNVIHANLGAEYGVSGSTITAIQTGKTWGHVTGKKRVKP